MVDFEVGLYICSVSFLWLILNKIGFVAFSVEVCSLVYCSGMVWVGLDVGCIYLVKERFGNGFRWPNYDSFVFIFPYCDLMTIV